MDGTLVDSIAAVEAAWSSVAAEIGKPADEVIAATHGRRAIDNLRDLKPKLRRLTNEQMEPHVEEFEKRILKEADEFTERVRSRRSSASSSRRGSTSSSRRPSQAGSRRGSSSSGPNPLLTGLAGGQFGMTRMPVSGRRLPLPRSSVRIEDQGESQGSRCFACLQDTKKSESATLEHVSAKLANLDTNDRMAQLDNPFDDDDDDDDDEDDDHFDLNDYTEEEIGWTLTALSLVPVSSAPRSPSPPTIPVSRTASPIPTLSSSPPRTSESLSKSASSSRTRRAVSRLALRVARGRSLSARAIPVRLFSRLSSSAQQLTNVLVRSGSREDQLAGRALHRPVARLRLCSQEQGWLDSHQCAHPSSSFQLVPPRANIDSVVRTAIDAHPPDHPRHGSRGSFVAVHPDWREMQQEARQDRQNAVQQEAEKAKDAAISQAANGHA
ncbi:SPOSA6832_00674, partial [Sporobolomyces salmonicolor]